jgi:NAD-dependent deacetylase
MVVYPAAGLIHYVPYDTPKFVVDPKVPDVGNIPMVQMIADKASTGMERLRAELLRLR